jgi:major intracellular serine protease
MKKENLNEVEVTKSDGPKSVGQNEPGEFKVESVVVSPPGTIEGGLHMLSIPSLWQETRGQGIKVAVLDTGIAYNHPHLSEAIGECEDFTGSKAGPADLDGHGTHVAGIIAARKDGSGVVGVAPMAELLIGKVLGDNGTGLFKALEKGIRWAINREADIISLSLGSSLYDESVHDAVKKAVEKGIFVICAAGNHGRDLDAVQYPAKFPETVAVGAIDRNFNVTDYSSRGDRVDIAAPGEKVLSTYPPRIFAVLNGTSMATPFVSGVVALMLAKHRNPEYESKTPVVTQKDLIEHLRKTAIDIGPTGPDPDSGFGLINPVDLLNLQEPGEPEFIK